MRVDDDGASNPVNITGATFDTYVLTAADVGKKVKVRVSFQDDLYRADSVPASTTEMLTSAAFPATGTVTMRSDNAPAISGTARFGQTLTAEVGGIADDDGLPTGPFPTGYTFQWLRIDGTTEMRISGATSRTYTLVADDVGKTIKVEVGFTDMGGNPETRTSSAQGPVTAIAPGAPNSFTATAGDARVRLAWEPPASNGGAAITRYQVRHAAGTTVPSTETWRDVPDSDADGNAGNETAYTVTGLANGTEYAFEVRAVNSVGESGPAGPRTATPVPAPCPEPDLGTRRQVWNGTVTVGALEQNGAVIGYGFSAEFRAGDLDDATFSIGSNDHVVDVVAVARDVGLVGDFRFSLQEAPLSAAEVAALRLHVCGASYDFSAATHTDTVYDWDLDLDWSAVSKRELYLSVPANRPATGAPTVAGTAVVGETLAAGTSAIADDDGLTGVTFIYQWLRVAADNTETAIDAATAATYVVTSDDVGRKLKVRVTFKDNLHVEGAEPEARTSAATSTVSLTGSDELRVVSVERHDPAASPTNADRLTWRVTFSESVTNVDAADFAVEGTTATLAVTGSAARYDVSVSGGDLASLDAKVTLRFAAGQDIADLDANTLADTAPLGTNDNTWEVDNTAPTVTITDVPAASNAPFRATFSFSEAVSGFTVNDITVGNGDASAFSGADGDAAYQARITPAQDGEVTVDVGAGAAMDRAGNGSRAAARATSTFQSLGDGEPSARVDGATLTLSFAGKKLDPSSNPSPDHFTVTERYERNGDCGMFGTRCRPFGRQTTVTDPVRVDSVRMVGDEVVLRLGWSAVAGRKMWLDYDPTRTGGSARRHDPDATALMFTDGTELAAFESLTVDNDTTDERPPELVRTKLFVEGNVLTMTFDEKLDTTSVPAKEGFEVRVLWRNHSNSIAVNKVSVVGDAVRLTLARPVRSRELVWLTYRLRGSGIPVKDTAGNAQWGGDDKYGVANRTPTVLLRVGDASVEEAPDAVLEFTVKLDAAQAFPIEADYATRDHTATAELDYTPVSGTLTFTPGQTQKTVSVVVLADAHDELDETLWLVVSSSDGAHLEKSGGRGIITNTDVLQQAWVGRFGRAVGSQLVEALGERLDGGATSHVQVGGVSLHGATPLGAGEGLAPSPWLAAQLDAEGHGRQAEERTLTGRDLLLGSSFHLVSQHETGGGPGLSAWGRVGTSGFRADAGGTSINGDVTTGMVGVDAEWERVLAGVLVAHSEGDGAYALQGGADAGTVESTLTGVYPYARLRLGDRLSVWGLAGAGSGDLRLRRPGEAFDTGVSLRLGALGVEGSLLEGGAYDLAVRSDVLWTGTDSDAVEGLAASSARVHRVRLIVEGARSLSLSSGATLTPTLQLGLRHDGGDAETGAGVEVGAGLRYRAGTLSADARVRTLLAHEADGYEEWGASGSIRLSPSASGLGPSLAVAPSWGAPGSGVARLWSHPDASTLVRGAAASPARVDAELGWGLAALHGRGVLTPYTRLALAEGEDRRWHVGARLALAESLDLGVEGTAHHLALRAAMRW